MGDEISWHIGKEAGPGECLDAPPYKAYFYWKQDGIIVHSREFLADELEAEIKRRQEAGEQTVDFKEALRRLQLMQ